MVPLESRKVVNKLVICLIALNREITGVANNGSTKTGRGCWVKEPNDRRVIARGYVNQRRLQPEPISKFANRLCGEQMRPGQAATVLVMVLVCAFTNNNVRRDKLLTRVLPTSGDRIGLPWVPVETG